MSFGRLRLDRDGHLGTLTLSHPPANAIDLDLLRELTDVLAGIGTSDGTRALVIRSDVPQMFMAGADLHLRAAGEAPTLAILDALQGCLRTLERVPVATIAAIDGHALGGGCELALACDFRCMSRGTARIGLPEVRLGLLAAGGAGQRLVQMLGRARALDLVLRARTLDADEAAAIGLVTSAHDPDELDAAVLELAGELARRAPLAVAAAKHAILEGAGRPLEVGLALEALAMLRLDETDDAREGVVAFVERRTPRFTGA